MSCIIEVSMLKFQSYLTSFIVVGRLLVDV